MKGYFLLLYKVPYKEDKACFLCYLLSLYHIEVDLGSEDLHSKYTTTEARVVNAAAKPINTNNLHDQILYLF